MRAVFCRFQNRGVVVECDDDSGRIRGVGLADKIKKRRMRFAVAVAPNAAECFVQAVLRVGLRKHQQFGVGRGATGATGAIDATGAAEKIREAFAFARGKRDAVVARESGEGFACDGCGCVRAQSGGSQRARRMRIEKPNPFAEAGRAQDLFGHFVVDGFAVWRRGFDPPTALDAAHGIEAAAAADIARFRSPRRNDAEAGQNKRACGRVESGQGIGVEEGFDAPSVFALRRARESDKKDLAPARAARSPKSERSHEAIL